VDPEIFLRHLNFRALSLEANGFTLPALPSSSSKIISLRVASVFCRQHGGAHDQGEIERLRKTTAAQMKNYFIDLRRENSVKTGDSVVRSFAVHDQEHYSLEQDVSVCVNDFGSGWSSIQRDLLC
jgi:hypothetical protein